MKRTGNRFLTGIAILMIRCYQAVLAPLFVGGACRHVPSCSAYAIEAFEQHGFIKGTTLAAKRIWRCRPGGSMGYDPVPEATAPSRAKLS